MTEDYYETEQNLLGSILTNDENEFHNCERIYPIQNKHPIQQILNNDSFSKSFEQITLNSDCHGSPTSPNQRFHFKTPLNYTTCSSFSSDNNLTSLDNSTLFGNNPCFEYFQKSQEQISPLIYSQVCWPHYSKQYSYQDPQLAIDIDNMCGNQILSRKVQKIFENGTLNQKQQIFQQIEINCIKFSKDIFGNYVVQKILELGNKQQKQSLFIQLQPYIAEISKNNYGCRVIQKLIEVFGNQENQQKLIIKEIQQNIQTLLLDQTGKYVILKCLEIFPKQKMEFLLYHVLDLCSHMCQSQYGCKIIQKIIEFYPFESESLIQKCIKNQKFLYQSQHGNYIIQYAIQFPYNIDKFVDYIFQNLEDLCFNKYASNTVEAILQYLNQSQQQKLVEFLINVKGKNNIVNFVNISTNPYGNYVIKRLLQIFDPQNLKPIFQEIKIDPNLLILIKSSEFGQRISALLNTQLNDYN